MSTSLDGKTALVTGAGRGIGRAVAIGLASTGATLAWSHGLTASSPRRGPTRTEGTAPMGEALDQLAATTPPGKPGLPRRHRRRDHLPRD